MATWTFVKRFGAPTGAINLDVAGVEYVINDTDHTSIVVTDPKAAADLNTNPYLTLSGTAGSYTPPNIQQVELVDGVLSKPGLSGSTVPFDGSELPGPNVHSLKLTQVPFAFDTPNLATGIPVYTPEVGEILYDVWAAIQTAWDGDTPIIDAAVTPIAAISPDLETYLSNVGILGLGGDGPVYASGPSISLAGLQFGYLSFNIIDAHVPMVFATTDPLLLIVAKNGVFGPSTAGSAFNFGPTPSLTVTTSVNDTFKYTPAGGSPEVFTVAAGDYEGLPAMIAGWGSAVGTASDTFSDYVTISTNKIPSATIGLVSTIATGAAAGGEIDSGDTADFLNSAFSVTSIVLAGGFDGGDPGSTQGAGILNIITAKP